MKKSICLSFILVSLLCASCVEELKTENFYTFTGEMIADYLDNRSETFSSFTYVLERAGVKQLLAAYGEYTCFAPTNDAFDVYLREKGYADLSQLTDADCDTIAFGHVIKVAYLTTDLDNGVVGSSRQCWRRPLLPHSALSHQHNGHPPRTQLEFLQLKK